MYIRCNQCHSTVIHEHFLSVNVVLSLYELLKLENINKHDFSSKYQIPLVGNGIYILLTNRLLAASSNS